MPNYFILFVIIFQILYTNFNKNYYNILKSLIIAIIACFTETECSNDEQLQLSRSQSLTPDVKCDPTTFKPCLFYTIVLQITISNTALKNYYFDKFSNFYLKVLTYLIMVLTN